MVISPITCFNELLMASGRKRKLREKRQPKEVDLESILQVLRPKPKPHSTSRYAASIYYIVLICFASR